MIDADATIKYLREFRCKDCDRRKGMKNGKIRFFYEIGEAPCRACDIDDTINYFLDEDISPTIDAVPVVRCKNCKHFNADKEGTSGLCMRIMHGCQNWGFCADGERKQNEKP